MSTPSVPSLPESTLRVAWFGAGEECALDGDATVEEVARDILRDCLAQIATNAVVVEDTARAMRGVTPAMSGRASPSSWVINSEPFARTVLTR